VVQVVLQNDRGREGVDLAALAHAPGAATLAADNCFGRLGAESLVPHVHRHTHHSLSEPSEIPGSPSLATFRAIGIERQTDHHPAHAFAASDLDQVIEYWPKSVQSFENFERAGQHAQLITQRDAQATLAGVDAHNSTGGQGSVILGRER
jgi:hypothetical protein